MKLDLDRELSFLKEVSKNDRKLISGGAAGKYRSTSSVSATSFISSRNGVASGSGRTSSTVEIDGVVVKSDEKSFNFGPISGPFSFSIESSTD